MKRLGVLESGTGIGGAEINLVRLAPMLRAAGWELVVLVPGEGRLTAELLRRNICWFVVQVGAFKSTSRYLGKWKIPDPFAILYDLVVIFRYAVQVAQFVEKEQIAVLHTNSMLSHLVGGLAAVRSGCPCVWHMQDIVNARSGLFLFRPFLNVTAWFLPTTIVCISRAVACQFWAGLQKKIHIIYNGVDTDAFTPDGTASFRTEWLGERFTMVIGQVGRLTPWKGQDIFLGLAERARLEHLPMRFVLVGDDGYGLPGYRTELANMAEQMQLQDQILFLNWCDNMPEVFRSLDVLVHPSREPEPFGLVLAEAMACGRPVLIFDRGGASEVVAAPDCGLAVPPADSEALWQAVKWVYAHQTEAAAMGSRARSRVVSQFSFQNFANQMLELYDTMVKQSNA